jgi:hypothetical protein
MSMKLKKNYFLNLDSSLCWHWLIRGSDDSGFHFWNSSWIEILEGKQTFILSLILESEVKYIMLHLKYWKKLNVVTHKVIIC